MTNKRQHGQVQEKEYNNSIVIEKARYTYFDTSNDGRMTIYFRSGLIYEFKNVKPLFAKHFLGSSDQNVATAFNKYISNNFIRSKVTKTKKFYECIEKAKNTDKQRKLKKEGKQNAKLVQ